jgi:GTP-binding protein HflX
MSHDETEAQAEDVNDVLTELGLDETRRGHVIEVWNKADLLDPLALATRETQALRRKDCVLVSAIDGSGTRELLEKVETFLGKQSQSYEVTIEPEDGKGAAWLHERGEVLDRKTLDDGSVRIVVRLDEDRAGQAESRFGKAMRKTRKGS